MTRQSDYGIFGMSLAFFPLRRLIAEPCLSAQSRAPIQILDEARDAVQTIHVSPTTIITGSVDGHVRTYDLRKGELRSDFIGRMFYHPTLFKSLSFISTFPKIQSPV